MVIVLFFVSSAKFASNWSLVKPVITGFVVSTASIAFQTPVRCVSSKLFKSALSIKVENASPKIEIFNRKQHYKFSQCRSYGQTENLNLINLSFFGKDYFKTTLKLNFLD